jgi:hypothetical protein
VTDLPAPLTPPDGWVVSREYRVTVYERQLPDRIDDDDRRIGYQEIVTVFDSHDPHGGEPTTSAQCWWPANGSYYLPERTWEWAYQQAARSASSD